MANRRGQGLSDEQINQILDQDCEAWFDDVDDQSDLGSFDAESEKDYHLPDEFGDDDSEDEVIHMELEQAPDVFLLDQSPMRSPMRLRPIQSYDIAPVHGPSSSANEAVIPSEHSSQGSLSDQHDQSDPSIQAPASDLAPVHGAPLAGETPSTSRAADAPVARRQLVYPQPSPSTAATPAGTTTAPGISLRTGKYSRKVPRGGHKNQWTMRAQQNC